MAAPMFYRPAPKWHVCAALGAAVSVHAAAVAIAAISGASPPTASVAGPLEVDVIIDDSSLAQPAEAPPPNLPPPPPPEVDNTFAKESATPVPIRPRVDRPSQRLVKAAPGAAARMSFGAAKVFAISAPRPEYPYEARRQRATGSGVALLTVDPISGSVTNVRMLRSTGNIALDDATISGLRRWRFRPGTVSVVQTPITYTLTGAAF